MMVLQGIKVLDLSRVAAGPFAGMILGDLGADVIKVEEPDSGDESRYFPPFQNGLATFYLAFNRNKRGLTLNLKEKQGQETFYKLAKTADVIIENYKTGVVEKLQIDYSTIKIINPNIVYCSIAGYGRKGPKADEGAYEAIAQAHSGLMSVTGTDSGQEPVRVGYSMSDVGAGMNAVMGILAALYHREISGEGQYVETSLLLTQIGFMSYYATTYLATKKIPAPLGSGHPSFAPYQAIKAKDGHIIIGISNERQWKKFCVFPGLEKLEQDERFKINELRVKNKKQLIREIEIITTRITKKDLIYEISKLGVPCGPINNIKEVIEDPQVVFNKMLVEMEHPVAGQFLSSSVPFLLEKGEYSYRKYPPLKGEHNYEILSELGLSKEQINEMEKISII